MSATLRFRKILARRLALSAAFAICLSVCGGCLMDSSPESPATATPSPATQDAAATALRDQSAKDPSIPKGCTREWSAGAMDSVLYCPDIRPPKPH